MTRDCSVVCLGQCDYQEAYQLQKQLLCRRIGKRIPDTLILLQHPPVITVGRKGARRNILVDNEVLCREGIPVYNTDRGGDITYHGPGQIVGYPILDLNRHGRDVHKVIYMFEEVIIRLLAGCGIEGTRLPDYPGVWVGSEKICAIGIGISNWVTYHGFALNVNTNLAHFSFITPCGIPDRGVTSMARLLGRPVDELDVAEDLVKIFGMVFNLQMKRDTLETVGSYGR